MSRTHNHNMRTDLPARKAKSNRGWAFECNYSRHSKPKAKALRTRQDRRERKAQDALAIADALGYFHKGELTLMIEQQDVDCQAWLDAQTDDWDDWDDYSDLEADDWYDYEDDMDPMYNKAEAFAQMEYMDSKQYGWPEVMSAIADADEKAMLDDWQGELAREEQEKREDREARKGRPVDAFGNPILSDMVSEEWATRKAA